MISIIELPGLEIEMGDFGSRGALTSEWQSSYVSALAKYGVRELVLNVYRGWRGNNVDFLRSLPFLQVVDIFHEQLNDIDGLTSLRNLEGIGLTVGSDATIDLELFDNLKELSLTWSSRFLGLAASKSLERLSMADYPKAGLDEILGLSKLEYLRLNNCAARSIDDIGVLSALRNADFAAMRRLEDLSPIYEATSLRRLELNLCRGMHGEIEGVERLRRLRVLGLTNCGPIASLKPVVALPELEMITIDGSTDIVDGALSVLEQLPNLKHVVLRNRRHYDRRRAQLPSFAPADMAGEYWKRHPL